MNTTSRTTLQALGSGLAGAAAAAIANQTAKRVNPNYPRLDFLGKRLAGQSHILNPWNRGSHRLGIAGNLISSSLLYSLVGAMGDKRHAKRNWLRGALLGLGAGLGALATPHQKRNFWGKPVSRTKGTKLATIGKFLAGGLAAAAASGLIGKAARRRNTHSLFD
ncbi:MAG: hypothetical protein AB7U82_17330 [Blastocatellales bacterium]